MASGAVVLPATVGMAVWTKGNLKLFLTGDPYQATTIGS